MKKNQQKVIISNGKDELNLVECPFCLLSDRMEGEQKTLKFTDKQDGITRRWTVTGSDAYGLPHAADEEIYIGMLALSKRDGFKDRKVYFNQYELLKLMGWATSGREYKRLELAMTRLCCVTVLTDFFWSQGKFTKGVFLFHIIEEAFLDRGKRNSKNSYFVWSSTVYDSLVKGNLKNLNLDVYFDLKTPISKRFYRLWDKRLYKTDQVSFDLRELCHEKLGISRKMIYYSELKRKLEPTLREHKEKRLLSSAVFTRGKGGNCILTVKRYAAEDPEPIPLPEPAAKIPKEDPLLEKLFLLKIPLKRAKAIIQTYSRELIEGWLLAVDMVKPSPKNRAGYLLKALEEKWELPEEVLRKRETEKREREKKLKEAYDKFIIDRVDAYLKTLPDEQIETELKAHEDIFYAKYPRYEEFRGGEGIQQYIRHDYKMTLAAKLQLPSFEEWRKL